MAENERPQAGEIEERTTGGVEVDGKKIRGVIPFGALSADMGGWREQISPTALRNADISELRCVIDHKGLPLGRYPKTLDIEERSDGLHWALDPPRSRQDVIEAVERGDLVAGSWRMVVAKDSWQGDTRTVEEISRLLDVTICGAESPAYPAAAVEYRSQPASEAKEGVMAEQAEKPQEQEDRSGGGWNVEDRVEVTPKKQGRSRRSRSPRARSSVGEVRSLTTAISLSNPEYSTNFFDVLRPQSAFLRSGVRTLTTSSDSVVSPMLTSDSTLSWYSEGGTILASDPGLGAGTAVPHKLAVRVEFSNQLAEDSAPGIEQILRQVLTARAAIVVDTAAYEGTGTSPQPLGMGNVSGIGNVNASAANTNVNWAGSAVAYLEASNAARPFAYVGGTTLIKDLRQVRGGTANDAYLIPVGSEEMPMIYGASGYLAQGLAGGTAYVYSPQCCYLVNRTSGSDVEINRARLFDTDQSEMRLRARLDYFFPYSGAICRGTAVP